MNEIQFWLPAGTVVGDRYELETVLGVGGYGITYKGTDIRLGRIVAVKEYYPGFWVSRYADRDKEVHCQNHYLDAYERGMERFLDEAKTLVSLSDVPEVVRVSDFFEENNTAYLVMDYLDGQNLKQMSNGFGGRIPAEILVPVMGPIIKALGKIHEKGMIHRDLSPDNIMMLEDGSTKLIDFGNARDTSNNKSMTLAMKQGFAAPEQYKSRGQGTFTDVYGICATMYYCLTGKLPPQAMERLTGTPFLKPSELGIEISPVWEDTIMDGLELYVQKRIQTMEELWNRLYSGNGSGVVEENVTKNVTGDVTGNTANTETEIKTEPVVVQDSDKTEPIIIMRDHDKTESTITMRDHGKTEPINYDAQSTENKMQASLEIIRNACIQIFKMLKEK